MSAVPNSNRGLVLINALLVVAALSAVAVVLLRTAETARNRQFYLAEVAQAEAYLDGFELLLRNQLDLDRSRGAVDHLGEAWAQENYTVAIDRGTAVGTIRDLQARFNLSWLAGEDAAFGADAFQRLLQDLGLRERLGIEVIAWLSEKGPKNLTPYLALSPRLRPSGGQIGLLDELRLVDGMAPEIFAKLEPVLTAVSADSVNINTASRAVLQAVMPKISPAVIGALITERRSTPFDSNDAVNAYLRSALTEDEYDALQGGVFATASSWFEADISVQFGQTHLARRVVFRRTGGTGKTRIEYRFTAKQ